MEFGSSAERSNQMRRFRINEIFSDPRRILLAVESVQVDHSNLEASYWLYASIKTVAIIVLDQKSTYALSVEAKPMTMELLRKDIPDLDVMIGQWRARISLP